ncbi:MAG TPA: DUF2490 domain-containing protein [Ginsengibacter sp.]|nr:DUF2490 domain-containing protein [Ginsengibacter sp.]
MLLITILLLYSVLASAQKSDVGNWFIYFGNQQINKRWNWWNEVQYRNFNFAGDLEQLLLRTGIGYNLTENNNNILLGYGYILSNPYVTGTNDKTTTTENRIYEQFITRQNFGRVFIQHRYRLEERFLSSGYKMRFRYFLSFNVPINKPLIEKGSLYLSAYNEIFLNFKSPVFDRDRLYGALGFAINKYLRIETGIMYQIYETSSRPQFQIVFFNNSPLSKNKAKSK